MAAAISPLASSRPAELLQNLSPDKMHGTIIRILLLGGINLSQRFFVSFASQVNPSPTRSANSPAPDQSVNAWRRFFSASSSCCSFEYSSPS